MDQYCQDILRGAIVNLYSEKKFKSIPVVMTSIDDNKNIITACRRAGVTEYLIRPITSLEIGQLIEKIRKDM